MLEQLPAGMEWLALLRSAPPGALIWGEVVQAETGDEYFVFALREETPRIKRLPQSPTGGTLLDVRMGVMAVTTEGGQRVAYVPVLMKARGDTYETNFNVLHFTDKTLELLGQPYLVLLVGDSGMVERGLWFPANPQLEMIGKRARELFEEDPWTDPDFDEAKAIVMESYPLTDLWEQLGETRRG
jgi:hypothetical protein